MELPIIPPEVIDDELYRRIEDIARAPYLKTFLEIGSSAGAGSTRAFIAGIQGRLDAAECRLFCLEWALERFNVLREATKDLSFVVPRRLSSILPGDLPADRQVSDFYANTPNALRQWPLQTVLDWLRQDRDYIAGFNSDRTGIEQIKSEFDIGFFDMVFIDGGEFAGIAELPQVYGATMIALDDVNTYKNYSNFYALMGDSNYRLIYQNLYLRHGYAIFEHRRLFDPGGAPG